MLHVDIDLSKYDEIDYNGERKEEEKIAIFYIVINIFSWWRVTHFFFNAKEYFLLSFEKKYFVCRILIYLFFYSFLCFHYVFRGELKACI